MGKDAMAGHQDNAFQAFADYIRKEYGIHFKGEKKTLIEGRLAPVWRALNIHCLGDYLAYVQADQTGAAASVMLDRITTNHTFFMREPAHFSYFRDQVLPYLSTTVRDRDLRIWSAACSSGEEPYTLAMIMADYFGQQKKMWNTQILATDISSQVLSTARQGIYSREKTQALPESWRTTYFKPHDDAHDVLTENIRSDVIFSHLNLVNPRFPFKKGMHVIFCRNVMIYFDQQTKEDLINRLYENTQPGGFLFVGHSESIDRDKTRYRYIQPSVYRKEPA